MSIDPRLNEIDDCLYRVAVRVLVVHDHKLLLVKEADDDWWALPGGGVDHGETIELTVAREVEEELGVPATKVTSDFAIAGYTIGSVVNNIPRMNLFFKVNIPPELITQTAHVETSGWFTEAELHGVALHPSYDKATLLGALQ